MMPIMEEYPRKKYKRQMIQGVVLLIIGLVLALLIGPMQKPLDAEQTIALFRFIGIMGGASMLFGSFRFVKGFFDWVQS